MKDNSNENFIGTPIKKEQIVENTTSLEDLIISTQMNGWILQIYRELFSKRILNVTK